MDKQGIIEASRHRREGERIFYTSCPANGCWDSACILKCHAKDGRITAIEPDDSVNRNDSREDCGWENIWKGNVQMRPCAMGHAWKKELYAETRLLHPMKRVGEKGAGRGYFVPISWEEALDTIAEKMREVRGKYGPYGIFHSQYPSFEKNGFPLAPWWEAGFGAWGEHSTSGHAAGEMLHLGVDLSKTAKGLSEALPGFEASDIFNSKLFVMWGMDPVVAWFGPTSYYMQLAHEYGCKTIVIDPRYTQSAELLADQWIPIRPGTDLAMMLAVAQVLYEEDLIDHEFVDQWVDKAGFEEWRAYCMGEGEDGIKKTPEWAAPICAVPAETIREFARLYGTTKPVHLQYFYSCAKRHMGDYSASASMLLQAMTGNIACAGGCQTGACLPTPGRVPAPRADFGRDPGDYQVPVLFNNNCLTEILACQKDYWEGRMSESEFRHRIGSPTNDSPLPNVQMIIFENNYANNHSNVNKRFAGMASTEFNWGFQWHLNQPTAELCDIILPAPVWQFEGMDEYMYGHQRFVSGPNGMRNYFTFCARGVDFPGEVRSKEWVWTEIAKRLGDEVVQGYNPRLADVAWEDWVDAQEAIYKEAFEEWADNETIMAYLGYDHRPTWEEFNANPVVRTEVDVPYYPFKTLMERGREPVRHAYRQDRVLVELREGPRHDRDALARADRAHAGMEPELRGGRHRVGLERRLLQPEGEGLPAVARVAGVHLPPALQQRQQPLHARGLLPPCRVDLGRGRPGARYQGRRFVPREQRPRRDRAHGLRDEPHDAGHRRRAPRRVVPDRRHRRREERVRPGPARHAEHPHRRRAPAPYPGRAHHGRPRGSGEARGRRRRGLRPGGGARRFARGEGGARPAGGARRGRGVGP